MVTIMMFLLFGYIVINLFTVISVSTTTFDHDAALDQVDREVREEIEAEMLAESEAAKLKVIKISPINYC